MKLQRIVLILFLCPLFALGNVINCDNDATDTHSNTKPDRDQWFKEAREFKHRFLIQELDLKKDQQKRFFELYDQMEDENQKLQHETRQMEKRVREMGDNASDLDYEKASEALFEVKSKEAALELKYREEFKKVLTPKQLFLLKGAERKFMRQLIDRHHSLKNQPPKR